MRARPEEYVVQTKVGGVSRSILWSVDHPLDLDLPRGWRVAKTDGRFVFEDRSDPAQDVFELDDFDKGQSRTLRLPAAKVGLKRRPLQVSLLKLRAPRPVYVQNPRLSALHSRSPRQLCAFYGQRYFLIHYRPVGARYAVAQNNQPIFNFRKSPGGYTIGTRSSGVQLNIGGRKQILPVGGLIEISELDFFRATIVQGIHWWRFRMVPTPDGQPPLESDETDEDLREATRLQYSAVGFLSLVGALLFSVYMAARLMPPTPKQIRTEVTLKQPKVFPAFEPPKPPPEIARVEPPKPPEPEPPKKEPPKPVAKVKPKKEPPREVAKKAPVKPERQRVAKAAPKPKPEPAAAPPPPTPVVAKDPGPSAEQLAAREKAETQAAEKAQMLKSLNFLSTSKSRPTIDASSYESKEGKFAETGRTGTGLASKSNVLDKMVKGTPGDGAITTKSGRSIASKLSFGKNKGLNDVQGKVSLGELTSKNGDPGAGLGGGKGLELTGPGSLTESQIEKALSKFLSKFQYCYEKALLADSSLGGNLVVQWNVTAAGRAGSSRVVKSQLNNGDLHACVLRVLGEVPFPKPKGGEVIVKKTFSFSSASM